MKTNTFASVALALVLAFGGCPVIAQSQVEAEVYAETDQPVAAIAWSADKRFFLTFHPFYNPTVKVAERLPDGEIRPYPDAEWQEARNADGTLKNPGTYFNWVLAAREDGAGTLWVLDSGQAEPRITPKLVAWDTKKNELKQVIFLPDGVTIPESQHNDFALSRKHDLIVISDEGIGTGPRGDKAALVVVNIRTGQSRRVLQGSDFVMPDFDKPMLMDGGTPYERTFPLFVGVDGIALDRQEEWLYFTPLNKTNVYRIQIAHLADFALTDAEIASHVEVYAQKPANGGMTIDADGNLYLAEAGTNTISVIPAATRQFRTYAYDEGLVWPDGINAGPDGYLYTSAAQVSLAPPFNDGVSRNTPPYRIYRFKPLAEPLQGQ